jgi:hypothetical protein
MQKWKIVPYSEFRKKVWAIENKVTGTKKGSTGLRRRLGSDEHIGV